MEMEFSMQLSMLLHKAEATESKRAKEFYCSIGECTIKGSEHQIQLSLVKDKSKWIPADKFKVVKSKH